RFHALFQLEPRQGVLGRRLLGLAKFSTKSRTAKTAALATSLCFFQRFQRRGPRPLAGGARPKPCNRRTLLYIGGQDHEPRQALPKRAKGIDQDDQGTTDPRTGAAMKPLGAQPCKGCLAAVFLC